MTVKITVGDQYYTGRGVATDIVEASVRAYLIALNRAAVAARAPARQGVASGAS